MHSVFMNLLVQLSILTVLSLLNFSSAKAQSTSALDFIEPHKYGLMSVSPEGHFAAFAQTETKKFCLDRFKTQIAKSQKCADKYKEYRSTYQIMVFDFVSNKIINRIDVPQNGHLSCLEWVKNTQVLACITAARTTGTKRYGSATSTETGYFTFSVGADENLHPPILMTKSSQLRTAGIFDLPWIVSPIDNDSDEIVFRAAFGRGQYEHIVSMNLNEEQTIKSTRKDDSAIHWVLNPEGHSVVRVDCKNRKNCKTIQIQYRKTPEDKWTTIRELKESDAGYIAELFLPFGLDKETGQIQVLSRLESDARSSIKLFDPETQFFTETLFQHPRHDIDRLMFDPISKQFVGAVAQGDISEYMTQDPELKAHYNYLRSQFGQTDNISIVDNNVRGMRAVVYVRSPETPGRYYLYDPKLKKLTPMMLRNKALDQTINSGAKSLQVTMRDGTSIDVYHYYPKNNQKGAPLIVMPHGGPHVRDYFSYNGWIQFLVSLGYQVVQMNFRGSTGYGIAHERAGFGEWGGLMQDDVTDTVKYMHENGYSAPEKTCIFGYSYGGYVALYGGGKTPELYACIISGAGVSDLVRSLKDDERLLEDQDYSYLQQSIGNLKKNRDLLEERSPANFAKNFTAPVLLIHGEQDVRVPRYHSIRMRTRLEDAGKEVTFVELKESAHNGWTLKNEALFLETVETFLAKHIGP